MISIFYKVQHSLFYRGQPYSELAAHKEHSPQSYSGTSLLPLLHELFHCVLEARRNLEALAGLASSERA
jgi:hypothetical protein